MKTPIELILEDEDAAVLMAALRALSGHDYLTDKQRINIAMAMLKLDCAIVAASKKETQALLARFEAAKTDMERVAIVREFQASL